jgi:6-phosphogluconolactonase (cycloisomerase 2 family)
MLAALALPGSLRAQGNFVYTNDDINGANTVSGFSVAANGALTLLAGSPFSTDGSGFGGGWQAANRITVSPVGNFLFAANTQSNNVSVFTINRETGALTLVGSPYGTDGSGGSAFSDGTALSATPDGKFLMAANSGSNNITVFSIASNGALGTIAGSPFPTLDVPDAIKVSPDGKFLAVSLPYLNAIQMFNIAANGSLTSLGAFPGRGENYLTGVDIDCANRLLYGAEANATGTSGTIVDGYYISHHGTLTPVPGSPFKPGVGIDSEVALLGYGPGRERLYVSNPNGATITAFSVAPNGSLSLLPGSPFPMKSPAGPQGMATSRDGHLLYVANWYHSFVGVSVFSVSPWGGLTEVAGSPFPTKQGEGLLSLVAFPPRTLSPLEALLDGCPVGP